MNVVNISCKKATFLISKKEEKGKITLWERFTLRMHLSICSLCKRFELQTGFIGRNAKHNHADEKLPQGVKTRIIVEMERL
ncbi:hypothetical protein [Parasediminibacterium sp. JCM 36343]|uniref:anti-sigma factor family protein n=1 Tax=Parasediminibacterium sp. JCM 36343 TaxID=3374279 RepID=UPI00397B077D